MEKFTTTVIVRDNTPEGLTKALKQFKKMVERCKIMEIYKSKQYYEKPSKKRRKNNSTNKSKKRT